MSMSADPSCLGLDGPHSGPLTMRLETGEVTSTRYNLVQHNLTQPCKPDKTQIDTKQLENIDLT